MLNKVYLILFVVAILFMATMSYLTNSQLLSVGFPPPQIIETFRQYENLHWLSLWLSTLVLLVISNVILWSNRKSWALWLTFLFFAIFMMVNTWWLTESLNNYQKTNSLTPDGILSKNGIFGAIFTVLGGIVIFFNQFLVFRMRDKMFPPNSEVSSDKVIADEVIKDNNQTN